MRDYLHIQLEKNEIDTISSLGLAHIGDGVFELMVRTWLMSQGGSKVKNIHRNTIAYVCAPAQAAAMEKMLPMLTEEELAVYKRGRNAHVNSVPKNAKISDYHSATGLESLFGWLYLNGRQERLNELFAVITEEE